MENSEFAPLFKRYMDCFSESTSTRNIEAKQLCEEFSIKLGVKLKMTEALYMLHNKICEKPLCEICKSKFVPLINRKAGYQRTCSIKCSRKLKSFTDAITSKDVIEKRKKSLVKTLSNLGVTNIGQLQSVKEKIKKTNQERYGISCSLHTVNSKEKTKKTNQERYGAENVLSTNSNIRKNINIQKSLEKEKTVEDKILKKKNRLNEIVEKYGRPLKEYQITNLNKYGHMNVFSAKHIQDKISKTKIDKYGSPFATQHPSIKQKISDSHINNYRREYLPEKLEALARLKIVPYGWTINEYTGGDHVFKHDLCGTIFTNKFYSGALPICPKCSVNRSVAEQIICSWLEEFNIQHEINNRTVIAPLEIDILTPLYGIEVNGVYWHSDSSGRIPLLAKTVKCENTNLKLLHFWDIEIAQKTSIVKSIILSKHGKYLKRFGARKLQIKEVSNSEACTFFIENHLQGFAKAQITYGLYNGDDLISAMSFGKPRWTKDCDYEIIRYATKLNMQVIGGAAKMFKHFLKEKNPLSIVSFADRRISDGNIYKELGFKFVEFTKPNYFWYKNNKCLSRYETQKHLLHDLLKENFDKALSENDNLLMNGWLKCSDSGNGKWLYKI